MITKSQEEINLPMIRAAIDEGRFVEAKQWVLMLLGNQGGNRLKALKLYRNIGMYSGDAKGIFEAYKELLQHKGFNNKIVLDHVITNSILSGSEQEVLALLKIYAERTSQEKMIRYSEAKLLEKGYDWSASKEIWKSILDADPTDQTAVFGYGHALFMSLEFEACLAFLNKEYEKNPKSWVCHSLFIFYHEKLFFRKKAIFWCERALELFPNDSSMIKSYIQNLIDFNDLEKSASFLPILENNLKNKVQLIHSKAYWLIESDEQETALELIDEYIGTYRRDKFQLGLKKATTLMHPSILRSRADALKALNYIQELYNKYSISIKVRILFARILILHNKYEEALSVIDTFTDGECKKEIKARLLKSFAYNEMGLHVKAKETWEKCGKHDHIVSLYSPITNLTLLSEDKEIQAKDIILFTVVRNEIYRLKGFLDYYRKQGIDKFIFVDNDSTDGSIELLLQEKDVIVYHTTDTYNQSYNGMRWVNELVEKYTTETKNWCIYADVDEFLIYPDCEVKSLKSLTQEMEQEGAEAMQGFMLDVFDPNSFVISINEDNPLKKDLIFYNDYYFDGWENPPYCHVIGGLRTYLYEKLNIILTKTPIIKGGGNIKFVASSHIISPAKIFSKRSCFIHLKYSSNFIDRAKEEAERKVHFKGAKRFKLYFENKNIFDTVLEDYKTNPKFVKFENSAQLSSLGLI